jgi:hypothetical protein
VRFALLLVVWLGWGIAYPVTVIALQGFDIVTLRCLVQLIGGAMLLGQAVAAGSTLRVGRVSANDLLAMVLIGGALTTMLGEQLRQRAQ